MSSVKSAIMYSYTKKKPSIKDVGYNLKPRTSISSCNISYNERFGTFLNKSKIFDSRRSPSPLPMIASTSLYIIIPVKDMNLEDSSFRPACWCKSSLVLQRLRKIAVRDDNVHRRTTSTPLMCTKLIFAFTLLQYGALWRLPTLLRAVIFYITLIL